MKRLLLIALTLTALAFVPAKAQKYVGGDSHLAPEGGGKKVVVR